MLEANLVSCILASREAYDALAAILDPSEFSEWGRLVVRCAAEYYGRDPDARAVEPSLLSSALGRTIANPKHLDSAMRYVAELPPPSSVPNVVTEYRLLRRHNVGLRLAALLATGDTRGADALIDTYVLLGRDDGARDAKLGVADLEAAVDLKGAIKVVPARLQEELKGRLMRGHHIIVFARPEAGKTSFTINLACGFLKQGLKVLHACNEEPIRDVQLRYLARLAGVTIDSLYTPGAVHNVVAHAGPGYGNLAVVELTSGRISEVDGLMRRWQPDVVVLDQLRNLKAGGSGGNRALELDEVSRAARDLGKTHNAVVVSITQAGDSADEKQVLGMGDIDWSNTGIQAAADLMIGIGVTAELDRQGKRWITLVKNKIGGRHASFPVKVDLETGRWSSIGPSREEVTA